MRTQKEIEKEIKALEACKGYAPKKTAFGDDNHVIINLQIEYLRGEIDTTCEEWSDFSDDEQSNILAAQAWEECQSDESPSSGWDSYKPKRKAK